MIGYVGNSSSTCQYQFIQRIIAQCVQCPHSWNETEIKLLKRFATVFRAFVLVFYSNCAGTECARWTEYYIPKQMRLFRLSFDREFPRVDSFGILKETYRPNLQRQQEKSYFSKDYVHKHITVTGHWANFCCSGVASISDKRKDSLFYYKRFQYSLHVQYLYNITIRVIIQDPSCQPPCNMISIVGLYMIIALKQGQI